MNQQVFVDTDVLINLSHIDCLHLLGKLKPFRFLAPAAVLEEVKRPQQIELISRAIESAWLGETRVEGIRELTLFSDLLQKDIGDGEAACLTLASLRGGLLASSDKGRKFVRAARSQIGEDRLVRFADLMIRSIRQGLLTVNEADAHMQTLADNRFHINVSSFAEWL